MVPNPRHRVGMLRARMGSLLRVRNHLHLLLMDRHRLLDLLRQAMGSMVTVSQAMVHRHLTLVHPLRVTPAMASSSHMVILMVVVAMVSLSHILLKVRHLLHPKTHLLLYLHLTQRMLLLLLLPTVVGLKLLRVKLHALVGLKFLRVKPRAPASAPSVILLLCSATQPFPP